MIKKRTIGDFTVGEIGLGCMNLSHAYGIPPSREVGEKLLHRAIELGVTHFDSAALYGFGRNEELVGPTLKPFRDKIFLTSKCGMQGVNGIRVIDGRPETLRKTLEDSLRRLQTDVIDLYYLHRWDKNVPIEESIGEMSRMVEAGKIRHIGLSEMSTETYRNAHAVHPIAAMQTEYSLWTRNAEISVLDACKQNGTAFIAFSPVARGFLTSNDIDPKQFAEKDIRRNMPRFQEPNFSQNRTLLPKYRALAKKTGCTPAQLALAWLLHQGPHVHVIPGTTSLEHLEENIAASGVVLSQTVIDEAGAIINQETVRGPRYATATQAEIDTEQFLHEI